MRAARGHVAVCNDPEGHAVEFPGGQLFWSQAQYVRAEYPRTSIATISEKDGFRAAVIAGLYGFWDLAIEILRKTPNIDMHDAIRAEFVGT
jgi:hypothetical protein